PDDWKRTKIVFPDIAEEPRFFLDDSGAVVGGECYWITLRENVPEDWLYLMLAVANSPLAMKFYDVSFHHKLYAGRRRFQTQFVGKFPLPCLDRPESRQAIKLVKRLLRAPRNLELETQVNGLIERAFGLEPSHKASS
ncbi:MAG: hypothetical protein N2C14_11260, partial [Planctomycetales bacterium]